MSIYEPRSGDGSVPAEDDALLRQPSDDVVDDPDLAKRPEDEPGRADGGRDEARED
ncbi:hypothetical protein QEZ54_09715 [Catellatospora sp. KI3]|uniref:hypothetical protein n=1 Tax=Catellatospora sp. KI3 TaxID=3041620 RepID=UPI002482BF98|nr:hypothetical protein [Catellatospora sp. KI3]MDI1461243.1 hypothetical protein [Catellatospora sp. KI3]